MPTNPSAFVVLMVGTRRFAHPTTCLFPGANSSVLETLIAAPPPGIGSSRSIFCYHFGAFDVVVGNGLCTLNRRDCGPCRGRAVAGRGGESSAAVQRSITRGCNRCPREFGVASNRPRLRFLWSGYLLRRFDHDVRKRGGGAARFVAVCAIAVPLRPHSGATAKLATKKSDENFTAIPPISGDGKRQSQNSRYRWPDANLRSRV